MNILESGSAQFPSFLRNDDGGLRGYPGAMYGRRGNAIFLQVCRNAGGCTSEKKICISPHGGIVEWDENLFGFTRVVVHGEDSLCAVARTEDLERVMRQGKEVGRYISNMHNALIYEAEDLTLPCGEVGKMTSRRIEKPFVAVSVAPSTNTGNEASGAEYDVDGAIKFVEEMDSGATSTFNGTLKTAIFTLDRLFGKTFKANEIEIFTVKKYRGRVMGLSRCGLQVTEYPIRGKRSIKDYLAVINKPCSGASSSEKWRPVVYKPCSGGSSREKWRLNVINKARKRRLSVINKARKRRLNVINKARKRSLL